MIFGRQIGLIVLTCSIASVVSALHVAITTYLCMVLLIVMFSVKMFEKTGPRLGDLGVLISKPGWPAVCRSNCGSSDSSASQAKS